MLRVAFVLRSTEVMPVFFDLWIPLSFLSSFLSFSPFFLLCSSVFLFFAFIKFDSKLDVFGFGDVLRRGKSSESFWMYLGVGKVAKVF